MPAFTTIIAGVSALGSIAAVKQAKDTAGDAKAAQAKQQASVKSELAAALEQNRIGAENLTTQKAALASQKESSAATLKEEQAANLQAQEDAAAALAAQEVSSAASLASQELSSSKELAAQNLAAEEAAALGLATLEEQKSANAAAQLTSEKALAAADTRFKAAGVEAKRAADVAAAESKLQVEEAAKLGAQDQGLKVADVELGTSKASDELLKRTKQFTAKKAKTGSGTKIGGLQKGKAGKVGGL